MPGVYIFLGKSQKILYIGKARNLRNRLNQYIQNHDNRPQVPYLMMEAHFIETIVVNSEREALILENNLIKQHKPKYNIDLKDDKSYPYIALTDEKFPLLTITRKPWQKFLFKKGPFTDAGLLKKMLTVLQTAFPLRRCKKMKKVACINKQIGLCPAPCENLISEEEYNARVRKIIELLNGKGWRNFSGYIKERMEKAAESLQFEEAATLRDSLKIVPEIKTKLGVELGTKGREDFFLFSFYSNLAFVSSGFFFEGKLKSVKNFYQTLLYSEKSSVILNMLSSFYETHPLPEKIALNPSENIDTEILSELFGKSIKLSKFSPEITGLLEKNLKTNIDSYFRKEDEVNSMMAELSKFTDRKALSILCIDVSTLYGEYTVVGAVWWEKGHFIRKNYRKFRIKTVRGTDDFASLAETAQRLDKRWLTDGWPLPDLLLIDGGKGQISSVRKVLTADISIAGIVKDRGHKKGAEKLINRDGDELLLMDSPLALLLKRVRDETHRFSIEYNRSLRKQKIETFLSRISGVGPKKERILIEHFRKLSDIKGATLEELQNVKGIPKNLAETIFDYLHSGKA